MNAVLIRAAKFFREIPTVAHCTEGEKRLLPLHQKVKLKGVIDEVNLRQFVPKPGDIKPFSELTDAEKKFIACGSDADEEEIENVYNLTLDYYELITDLVSLPEAIVKDLESTESPATDKVLLDVKGIGPKLDEVLKNIGIKTVEALAAADPIKLKEALVIAGLPQVAVEGDNNIIDNAKNILNNAE